MPILFACILASLASATALTATELSDERAVRFSLVRPDAREVTLAGSFNHWDPGRHRLTGPAPDGQWTITIPLAPGRYEYLFVVNGSDWVMDPAAPSMSDGFGSRNSVLLVPVPER